MVGLVILTLHNATMAFKSIVMFILLSITLSVFSSAVAIHPNQGKWKLLRRNIGISAMHMALLPNDRIITFDRTNFGPSNITFPQGKCPLTSDCFVHSVEFNPANRVTRPLTVLTDTWCSSGALSPDGVLVQSGGYNHGELVVRFLKPCLDCDWEEDPNGLVSPRWYASNQVLPNGKIIVLGGRRQFSYEFIPKNSNFEFKQYQLPFLEQTLSSDVMPNNLYPFLHLSTDGNLFVFANNRAILLDYVAKQVVREYPILPGGFSRNYPSTGSSVLLPLMLLGSNTSAPKAEVLVCGGTPSDSNEKAKVGNFVFATNTCGRIVINVDNAEWETMEMPLNRVMGDMIMLPTGDVLIINGAARGSAGWGVAREPVLSPVILYGPDHKTFEVMNPTTIPRLYHSSAHLLSDGRVLVGGSNPNSNYNFSTLYPTELSLEAFYPPYLCGTKLRPNITRINPGPKLAYKQKLEINFRMKGNGGGIKGDDNVYLTMVSPSFTTHSFAMNQRVLVLEMVGRARKKSDEDYVIETVAPSNAALAPPGYYQMFVVYDGVPSRAIWVHIN